MSPIRDNGPARVKQALSSNKRKSIKITVVINMNTYNIISIVMWLQKTIDCGDTKALMIQNNIISTTEKWKVI